MVISKNKVCIEKSDFCDISKQGSGVAFALVANSVASVKWCRFTGITSLGNSKGGCFTLSSLLCTVYGCYFINISGYEAPTFSSVGQERNEGNYTCCVQVSSQGYKHLSEEEKGFSTYQKCNASLINNPYLSCDYYTLNGPLNARFDLTYWSCTAPTIHYIFCIYPDSTLNERICCTNNTLSLGQLYVQRTSHLLRDCLFLDHIRLCYGGHKSASYTFENYFTYEYGFRGISGSTSTAP